jgi:hypothetical protein
MVYGRAIAQAVTYCLPIAAAQDRSRVGTCGNYEGQSGIGIGFLPVFRFRLPMIPPTAYHRPSSGAGTIGQIMSDAPSGFSLTPP